MVESCPIGTICAYEVVSNWHDLPKFVIFLNGPHFGKNKKKITPSWSKTLEISYMDICLVNGNIVRISDNFNIFYFIFPNASFTNNVEHIFTNIK